MMTRDEYIEECQALIDGFDDHVTQGDVVTTLRLLAERIEREGLEEFEDDPEECPACDTPLAECPYPDGACCEDCNHASNYGAVRNLPADVEIRRQER